MRRLLSRRKALLALAGSAACAAAGAGYAFMEARSLRVVRTRIGLPRLPAAFSGLKVGLMSDFHHSFTVPVALAEKAVELLRAEKPDLVLLGGDYVTGSSRYAESVIEVLGTLTPPLGLYGVLGNHDYWTDPRVIRNSFSRFGIEDLSNRGVWLRRSSSRLRLGGVADLWTEEQDLEGALGDLGPREGALIVTHNPDYAEKVASNAIDLLLCGHTHGGQVVLPLIGAPYLPSKYGMKYAAGLVRGPRCLVYITRGVGTVGPPVRLGSPPEVNVIELVRAQRSPSSA